MVWNHCMSIAKEMNHGTLFVGEFLISLSAMFQYLNDQQINLCSGEYLRYSTFCYSSQRY